MVKVIIKFICFIAWTLFVFYVGAMGGIEAHRMWLLHIEEKDDELEGLRNRAYSMIYKTCNMK